MSTDSCLYGRLIVTAEPHTRTFVFIKPEHVLVSIHMGALERP